MDFNLNSMTIEALEELKTAIEEEIRRRRTADAANNPEFDFNFEATSDPRKGTPYVARLSWDPIAKKIDREFFDMKRTWGKKEVTVFGNYKAKAGEIIEIRTGGSWNNDYRDWYLVTSEGALKRVASIDNSAKKAKVERYLRGDEISIKELL